MISVLHTWGRILAAKGGVLGVLLAVPAFRFGGGWMTCLRIAAFVLILELSMLLEEGHLPRFTAGRLHSSNTGARHGHPRGTVGAALALAASLHRAGDWFHSAGVPGPCDRVRRSLASS